MAVDDWGPHDCPFGDSALLNADDLAFWVEEDAAFVFGHEVTVTCPCGEPMDRFWVEGDRALVFECRHTGHGLTVHPASAHPRTWDPDAMGGFPVTYDADSDADGYVLRLDRDPAVAFAVRVPTLGGES